jgi:hypothetical protein
MKIFTLLLSLCAMSQGLCQGTSSDVLLRSTTSSGGSSEVVSLNGTTVVVQQSIGQASPIGSASSESRTVIQGFIQPNILAKILTPEIPESLEVGVYPNPFVDFLVVDFALLPLSTVTVSVFNILGSELKRTAFSASKQLTVDLSSLTSGYYFLKVECNGTQHVEKILKSK